ncbi:bactofilin family protein [Oceanospirillum sediminis]|uniref:Polymer-forming cytoskeletal protein n=1 Tax=Oceanospirillum sediminis TaxID=2760088 RepID=A0A839IVG6_9GAMM|nr:polymer-forming cytoskeletal protein [Oceanospirillum sediminis]MBB1488660.1 polymer-forming cytoskeletal protein [Oceanospirillum sediminis]
MKNKKTVPDTGTLISSATELVGDLYFRGHLTVDGRISGNLIAEDNAEASVFISDKGIVNGEVFAPEVCISGRVNGNVHTCQTLKLTDTAHVEGDIFYHRIEMAHGALLCGRMDQAYQQGDKMKGKPVRLRPSEQNKVSRLSGT